MMHSDSSTSASQSRIITLVCNCWFQCSNGFQPRVHDVLLFGVHKVLLRNSYKGKIKLQHSGGNIQPGLTHEKVKRKTKFNFSKLGILGVNFLFLYSLAGLGMPTFFLTVIKNYQHLYINKIYVFINNLNGCLLFHCVYVFNQILSDRYLCYFQFSALLYNAQMSIFTHITSYPYQIFLKGYFPLNRITGSK